MDLVPRFEELSRQAAAFTDASHAPNTRRAYESDWRHFSQWCREAGFGDYPAAPETVGLYLTHLAAECRVSTVTRRLAAIGQVHRAAGGESPAEHSVVRNLMRGIRRTLGTSPDMKRPLLVDDVKAMAMTAPATLPGLRDRALLLLGFAGGFRRSELVALEIADLEENREGMVIRIRRSKTDQEGEGRKVGIPRGKEEATCPVYAVRHWTGQAQLDQGPLFRPVNRQGVVLPRRLSGEAVALIVKRYAKKLGYDANLFAGHSLRAGLATSAAMAGKSERVIMNQTGHRSVAMVRRYVRDGNLFRDNAAEGLGL